jgi:hypothetical protein
MVHHQNRQKADLAPPMRLCVRLRARAAEGESTMVKFRVEFTITVDEKGEDLIYIILSKKDTTDRQVVSKMLAKFSPVEDLTLQKLPSPVLQ